MMEGNSLPTAPVQIKTLTLVSVEFHREEEIPEDATNVAGNFNLSASDPEGGIVRADFRAHLKCEDAWSAKIHYVIVLQQVAPFPEETDEEGHWETYTNRTAPVIMYPYVRETLTSLMIKAGIPPVMPPILDFSRAEKVDDTGGEDEEE